MAEKFQNVLNVRKIMIAFMVVHVYLFCSKKTIFLFICFSDPSNKSIRKISKGKILPTEDNQKYIVPWHESNEAYVFSANNGLHLETRSLYSDSQLLQFIYKGQCCQLYKSFAKKFDDTILQNFS